MNENSGRAPLTRRRLARWLIIAAAVVFPPLALFIGFKSYRAEKALFFPPRMPVRLAAAATGLTGITNVEFGSSAGRLRGWYVPSKNRAAVIVVHGAGGDRSQLAAEARILAEPGFGVLMFDWPGHGDSDGEVHWSAGERAALTAATDWLSARPDVDPGRIGVFGFSMGGYLVAQVAAGDPRLAAVVLAGVPSRVIDQSAWQFGRWGVLSRLPARWALRQGGIRFEETQPRDAVAALAPRPLLVVQGTADMTVPPFMAGFTHDAARPPKELYLVEGAGHGDYHAVAAVEYGRRLRDFFQRGLLADQGSGTGLAK